jgi:hypothetical protein
MAELQAPKAHVVPSGKRHAWPGSGAATGHTLSSRPPTGGGGFDVDFAAGASSEHATAIASKKGMSAPSIASLRRSIKERLEL